MSSETELVVQLAELARVVSKQVEHLVFRRATITLIFLKGPVAFEVVIALILHLLVLPQQQLETFSSFTLFRHSTC